MRLGFNRSNLPKRTTTKTPVEVTFHLVDNDDPEVSVSFGQASYSVAESDDAGTAGAVENEVTVTVTLSADPERSLTIPIESAGLAGCRRLITRACRRT